MNRPRRLHAVPTSGLLPKVRAWLWVPAVGPPEVRDVHAGEVVLLRADHDGVPLTVPDGYTYEATVLDLRPLT